MKYNKSIVPSIFTMLNLFFGFFSMVNAVQGKFVTAAWFILIASVWDALDGKIARFTGTHSEFGEQFDSITDVVSFGVAPSFLIYQVYFYKLGAAGIILSFIPLLLGAIRLARFNVNVEGDEGVKENFSGLPIPAMAGTISTYVMFNYDLWDGLRFGPILIPIVLFLSFLMVSHCEYQAMPKFSLGGSKKNTFLFVLLLLSVGSVIIFQEKSLFPLAFSYVVFYFLRSILSSDKNQDEEDSLDLTEY